MLSWKVLIVVGAAASVAIAAPLVTAILGVNGLAVPARVLLAAGDISTIRQGLNFAGNLTEYGTYVVTNASESGTTVARVALNVSSAFGQRTLQGGVAVAKQGLDLAKSFGLPSYGAKVGQLALSAAGSLGQFGLGVAAKGGDKALMLGNSIVQGGASKVNSVAQKGISVAKKAVNGVDNVKTGVEKWLHRISAGILGRNAS